MEYQKIDNMTFAERLKNIGMQTNDTEDDILAYIEKHRKDISQLSIQKIAKDLYTAPNSIMRLLKKLGYSGFAELKFAVQNEPRPQNKTLSRLLMEMLWKP